jgi:hypothetical protein
LEAISRCLFSSIDAKPLFEVFAISASFYRLLITIKRG